MDVRLETRLSRLEEELRFVQRSLSRYSGALRDSWGGRDGQAAGRAADQLVKKSERLRADLVRLRRALLQGQAELEEEAMTHGNLIP